MNSVLKNILAVIGGLNIVGLVVAIFWLHGDLGEQTKNDIVKVLAVIGAVELILIFTGVIAALVIL